MTKIPTGQVSILYFLLTFPTSSRAFTPLHALITQRAQVARRSTSVSSTSLFSAAESEDTTSTNAKTSATTPTSSNERSTAPFANFDYEDHWYPCVWATDLELNEPTKVTIFDVDYVVAKTKATTTNAQGEIITLEEVMAMPDSCTHKGAALSEGRVTASGHFQCAYHGWSFDGKSGECVEIPQIIKSASVAMGGSGGGSGSGSGSGKNAKNHQIEQTSATIPSRACGTAVPAQISQGMVWLFPGGGLEKALAAPPPPTLPEVEAGMKTSTVFRDMPVDWPIVLSNISDPDHGLFAHQNKNFDMYAASIDTPFEKFVVEETHGGKGWSLKAKIDAKDKIIEIDQSLRGELKLKLDDPKVQKKNDKKKKQRTSKGKKSKSNDSPLWATMHYHGPTSYKMKRVDKETGETKFVSFFYVCPVGVGRCRLLAGGASNMQTPRWLSYLMFNNFIDQDTYLLATQQHNILSKEADELRALMKEKGMDHRDDDLTMEQLKSLRMRTRRKSFVLPSPTDRIGAKLEQFWDETLARSPNRIKYLLRLDESGVFLQKPSREMVLDRKSQNLDLCKDSQDVVRNCRRVQKSAKVLAAVLVLAKVTFTSSARSSPALAFLPSAALSMLRPMVKTSSLVSMCSFLLAASYLAGKLEKEFYFKYTDDMRKRDMKNIPKNIWVDR